MTVMIQGRGSSPRPCEGGNHNRGGDDGDDDNHIMKIITVMNTIMLMIITSADLISPLSFLLSNHSYNHPDQLFHKISSALPGAVSLAQERHLLRWRALQVLLYPFLHPC